MTGTAIPVYNGPDRRTQPSAETPFELDAANRFTHIETRLTEGAVRMTSIEQKLTTNNEATAEVLEILQSAKGFFKVLGFIGTGVKWIVTMGAAFGALYGAYHAKN